MSNTEAELKLRLADPTITDHLLTAPLLKELSTQPPSKQTLETTYYDTADQSLLKSRLSYRLRLANGQWTATVKADGTSDGGLHQRAEYNVPVDSPLPSIEPFLTTDIGVRLAEAISEMPLEPVFSTRFERHIINLLTPDGSSIELALDAGDIFAGDKQQKILELELELKEGQPEALVWLGAALADDFPLLPELDSKLYRAAVLAGLAAELGRDTPLPTPLKKSSATQPALQILSQVIIYHIHEVISAQQTYLSNPDEIETLHDFRVALRKLRGLINFSKPLLPAEEYANWQNKLTGYGHRLGSVRDLDVFSLAWDELAEYAKKILPVHTAKPTLAALIAGKRQATRDLLYDALAAGQLTPVLLGLWAFMQKQANKNTDDPMPSLKEFALERLAHWLKQFLKLGSALDLADLDAVHELRIAGKRLRYTLDSLAPALPDNAQLLSKRLEKLQDSLGRIQDVAYTPPLLHELIKASASRLTHRDAGLITGWQLARSLAAVDNWDRIWTKVEKAVAKIKKLKLHDEGATNKRSPEM
ncbi:CYTH and CHAD domain-containing protein [Sporomusa malonica]|uniref:Inorganic triphosphatase YgiF, contains CYTH and CHAD domains n=1 Tax=Sporomusa malonica TaxID=112901 RepID=A0A1W2E425_9FIRM|nr:CYTH and CHAD domain-containing protein [Sporomusa malonica]SMD04509.1 Inorganic triphosphatase YgiF, contains CYTH and CHAD domains [Sporomusa malonica]